MRTFISVELPEEVKKEIIKIQSKLPEFQGKKTEVENLHLTLKFLGEIDEDKVKKVREKLREIKLDKFQGEIRNLGVFTESLIKIIWIYLANCNQLQELIDDKLKDLFEKEKRFMGHITLARVKKVEDKRKFLEELRKIKVEGWKFVVDRFYLKESILNEKGPEYKVIEEFKLI